MFKGKILAVSYLFPNSVYPYYGIFVLNRIRAASKYHDFRVINPIPWFPFSNMFRRYNGYSDIPLYEKIDGVEVWHPRFLTIPRYLKAFDTISYSICVVFTALKIRKSFKFDLIDLHWTYPDLPAGYCLKIIYSLKALITLRGMEAFYRDSIIVNKIIKFLLKRFDFVVSLSTEMLSIACEYGIKKERSEVVINGVDTRIFHFREMQVCREKLGLPANKKIILSVGSLIHRKGFDRIISQLPQVLRAYPDAMLYIVGSSGPEGDFQRELEVQIQEAQLTEYVVFVPAIRNSNLVDWYNAASVFCLASRGEGSPNVLSESLACGCPSISSDVGSASELVSLCQHGKIVSRFNSEALSEAILAFLGADIDRKSASECYRPFDWDWCAARVARIYEDLLERPNE